MKITRTSSSSSRATHFASDRFVSIRVPFAFMSKLGKFKLGLGVRSSLEIKFANS